MKPKVFLYTRCLSCCNHPYFRACIPWGCNYVWQSQWCGRRGASVCPSIHLSVRTCPYYSRTRSKRHIIDPQTKYDLKMSKIKVTRSTCRKCIKCTTDSHTNIWFDAYVQCSSLTWQQRQTLYFLRNWYLTRDCSLVKLYSAALAVVRMAKCLSVTLVYCVETVKDMTVVAMECI